MELVLWVRPFKPIHAECVQALDIVEYGNFASWVNRTAVDPRLQSAQLSAQAQLGRVHTHNKCLQSFWVARYDNQ